MSLSIDEHFDPGNFLEFLTREGRIYGCPYAQLLHYRLESNPALEHAPDAAPERLIVSFSALEVVITGWHLEPIRALLRSGKSFTISAVDCRYRNLRPKECFVAEIKVQNDPSDSGL